MVDEQIVHFVVLAVAILALGGIVMFFVLRKKRRDDEKAYKNVLHEPSVKTCYTPESYLAARNKQDKH